MAKNKLTDVSTTAITVATQAGYGREPEIINLTKSFEPLRSQWHEAMYAISETFFADSASARCVLEEIEIAVELKVEGGFRFMLSGNLAAAGSLRAKFRRKD